MRAVSAKGHRRGRERQQQRREQRGDDEPGRGRGGREHEMLEQQLSRHLLPRPAQGGANHNVVATRSGVTEQQRGDVGDGDQEQQGGRGQQDQQRPARAVTTIAVERGDPCALPIDRVVPLIQGWSSSVACEMVAPSASRPRPPRK